jgi:putative toxin-antitoxin system antitoxin component (TIGR02293 family)
MPSTIRVGVGSPMSGLVAGDPHYAGLFQLGQVERISVVRAGLPAMVLCTLAEDMQVTREQLYVWVGIPRATANRKIRLSAALSQDESERVLGLARLIGQVEQIVAESGTPEGFDPAAWTADWLAQPAAALGGKSPGEFLDTGDGRALVSGLISQMQSGAYA